MDLACKLNLQSANVFFQSQLYILTFATLSPIFIDGFYRRNFPMLSLIYLGNRPISKKFDICLVVLRYKNNFHHFSSSNQVHHQRKEFHSITNIWFNDLVVVGIILPKDNLYFITDIPNSTKISSCPMSLFHPVVSTNSLNKVSHFQYR